MVVNNTLPDELPIRGVYCEFRLRVLHRRRFDFFWFCCCVLCTFVVFRRWCLDINNGLPNNHLWSELCCVFRLRILHGRVRWCVLCAFVILWTRSMDINNCIAPNVSELCFEFKHNILCIRTSVKCRQWRSVLLQRNYPAATTTYPYNVH
jgi:hypothetical protein